MILKEKRWKLLNKDLLRLYLIASSKSFKNPLKDLEEAFKAGVTCFQLREKGQGIKTGDELVNFAHDVKVLCQKYDIPFIINDDVELAIKVEADGIHLGQDDIDPADLPSFFDDKIVGLSVGNLSELKSSNLSKVSYLGTGPVFLTTSKDDAGDAIGLSGLEAVAKNTELPLVAIGGINISNYKECLSHGADGISVISVITQSDNIEQTVTQLLK